MRDAKLVTWDSYQIRNLQEIDIRFVHFYAPRVKQSILRMSKKDKENMFHWLHQQIDVYSFLSGGLWKMNEEGIRSIVIWVRNQNKTCWKYKRIICLKLPSWNVDMINFGQHNLLLICLINVLRSVCMSATLYWRSLGKLKFINDYYRGRHLTLKVEYIIF